MATRQERMRDRMRGAGRHNVGDIDFGFIIPVAGAPTAEPEEPLAHNSTPPPPPPPATRPSPNTSAKRQYPGRHGPRASPTPSRRSATGHDIYSIPDASTDAGDIDTARVPPPQDQGVRVEVVEEPEDHPMADAPSSLPPSTANQPQRHQLRQRGPLSSIISATKRLAFNPSSPLAAAAHNELASAMDIEPRSEPDPPVVSASLPVEMEVTESPADAPGSGRRRPLRMGAGTPVVGSSVLLQKIVGGLGSSGGGDAAEDGEGGQHQVGNSSPIERRVARRKRARSGSGSASATASSVGGRTRFGSSSVGVGAEGSPRGRGGVLGRKAAVVVVEEDEEEVEEEEVEGTVAESDGGLEEIVEESAVQVEEIEEEVEELSGEAQEEVPEEEEEQEEAEEVGEKEAAQRLGRKRPRRSLPAPSPELGDGATEDSPVPKRRRRREVASPAQQQQPAKKGRPGRPPKSRLATAALAPAREPSPPREPSSPPEPSPAPPPPERRVEPRPKPKPQPSKPTGKKRGRKSKAAQAENEGQGEGESETPTGSVPVNVQRYTKPRRATAAAGDDAEDGENAQDANNPKGIGEIPFSNRSGVNAIDVLSTLCDELLEAYMEKLVERGRAAEDAATRREQKTMYRALEAFQEEVRTRLLEHTIALDTLHSLRKRVRVAQREKLGLRDEILRVRAEREQVALRMDAIRIRHEAESKAALRHITLSSTMHDIDLAVERGRDAPELSPAEQKRAELANLELLIGRVADQACSRSDGGGALRQIREFNAFLERAAGVLEGRS
ncbi:hypothetical protein B0J18DRAFT_481611 [Chaetomium sp. MPI-SDFR-AT-0129]|nr:hypothetical protein B0J18DRAFT_481611 [Chaetomium sp. MPI-SDFR-AT-0129]